jgi:hypothetical protein
MDIITLDSINTNRLKRNLGKIFKTIHEEYCPVVITRYRQPAVILLPINYNTKVEVLALRGCPGGVLITPAYFKDHLSNTVKEVQFGFDDQVHQVRAPAPPKTWPKSKRAIIIKFHSKKKHAFVLLPFYRGKEVFGKEVEFSSCRWESLPFTDMRKNRH